MLSIFLSLFLFSFEAPAPAESIDERLSDLQICINSQQGSFIRKHEYCRLISDQKMLELCGTEAKEFYNKDATVFSTASVSTDNKKIEEAFEQCKHKKNDLEGYPKCSGQVRDLYEAREAAQGIPSGTDSEDEKEALTKKENAEKAFKKCEENNEYGTGNKKCEEANKDFKDSVKDFNSGCGPLGGGKKCIKTIHSCDDCSFSDSAVSADLDCVLIKNQAICPELADGVLKDMKEEREDYIDKIDELQEKIDTLKGNKEELEAKLSDGKKAYTEDMETLQSKEAGLKEELEAGLKGLKADTQAIVQKATAQIQAEMAKTQQLQFELVNAIEAAHRKYRDSRNKVYRDCRLESTQKLNDHRKRRKAAIRHGRFRQESIFEMLQQNRVSFAQKDDTRYARYYNRCISYNKYLVQSYKEDLAGELKKIDQQKQLFASQLQAMQSQLAALNKQANQKDQQAVKDYATGLQKIIVQFAKQFHSRHQKYKEQSWQLGQQITQKDMEIMQAMGVLQETQNKFGHNKEMYNRLRAAGAPSEDKSSELADASEGYRNLESEWESAFESCDCPQGEFKRDTDPSECQKIKEMGRMMDPHSDKFQSPKIDKKKSTSDKNSSSGSS